MGRLDRVGWVTGTLVGILFILSWVVGEIPFQIRLISGLSAGTIILISAVLPVQRRRRKEHIIHDRLLISVDTIVLIGLGIGYTLGAYYLIPAFFQPVYATISFQPLTIAKVSDVNYSVLWGLTILYVFLTIFAIYIVKGSIRDFRGFTVESSVPQKETDTKNTTPLQTKPKMETKEPEHQGRYVEVARCVHCGNTWIHSAGTGGFPPLGTWISGQAYRSTGCTRCGKEAQVFIEWRND